jgi:hypothetical protein
LLGQFAASGYGPDRIVPLAFHVDYFNDPWKDPFSDAKYSEREMAYDRVFNRNRSPEDRVSLYFTPMLMVDGRTPMLGSNRAKAKVALDRALSEKPGVELDLMLEEAPGGDDRKVLKLRLTPKSAGIEGRDLLIGVATFEDPVTTRVGSGENGGKTLKEHYAVRRFTTQLVKLSRGETKSLRIPVGIEPGWDPGRCGLATFVQDEGTGRVYQAGSVHWEDGRPPSR